MYALCDTHMDTELKSPFIVICKLSSDLMHLRGVAFSEQSTASLLNFLILFLKDA